MNLYSSNEIDISSNKLDISCTNVNIDCEKLDISVNDFDISTNTLDISVNEVVVNMPNNKFRFLFQINDNKINIIHNNGLLTQKSYIVDGSNGGEACSIM